MYRIVVTGFVCPIRWMRERACSSIMGFHCGSRRYALDAAVRSKLRKRLVLNMMLTESKNFLPDSTTGDGDKDYLDSGVLLKSPDSIPALFYRKLTIEPSVEDI